MGNSQARVASAPRISGSDRHPEKSSLDREPVKWLAEVEEFWKVGHPAPVQPDESSSVPTHTSSSQSPCDRRHKSRKSNMSSQGESLDERTPGTSEDDEGYSDTGRIDQDIDMLFSYLDGWPDELDDYGQLPEVRYPSMKTNSFSGMTTLDETEEDNNSESPAKDQTATLLLNNEASPDPDVQPKLKTDADLDTACAREAAATNLPGSCSQASPFLFRRKVVALEALLGNSKRLTLPSEPTAQEKTRKSPSNLNMHTNVNQKDTSIPSLKRSRSRASPPSPTGSSSVDHSPEETTARTTSAMSRRGKSLEQNPVNVPDVCIHERRRPARPMSYEDSETESSHSMEIKPDPPKKPPRNKVQEGDVVTSLYSCSSAMPGTISFERGQSGVVMRLNVGGWCYVSLRDCEGWAPVNYWSIMRKHTVDGRLTGTEEDWMWGALSRSDCSFLLLCFGQDGDFLVRQSSTRESEWTLSVRHKDSVHYFAVKTTASGKFVIGNLTFEFDELADIILHYQQHTILSDTHAVLQEPFTVRFS